MNIELYQKVLAYTSEALITSCYRHLKLLAVGEETIDTLHVWHALGRLNDRIERAHHCVTFACKPKRERKFRKVFDRYNDSELNLDDDDYIMLLGTWALEGYPDDIDAYVKDIIDSHRKNIQERKRAEDAAT